MTDAAKKSCANCRWGDWFPKREEYLCWALVADEAVICKQTGYGTWEMRRSLKLQKGD